MIRELSIAFTVKVGSLAAMDEEVKRGCGQRVMQRLIRSIWQDRVGVQSVSQSI